MSIYLGIKTECMITDVPSDFDWSGNLTVKRLSDGEELQTNITALCATNGVNEIQLAAYRVLDAKG